MDTYFFSKAVFKMCKLLGFRDARWKLNKQFPEWFFHPHMERAEYKLFRRICKKRNTFLEYGSGGSTIMLLKQRKKVYSVDSNPEFFVFMNELNLVKAAQNKNLTYRFVDLGPTNKWGKPLSAENSDRWRAYYADIWNQIAKDNAKIDMVFIDGRFRVCCCLYSILMVLENGWNDTLIVIHDFWRRKKYHVVLDYLEEVESAQNLATFRVKKDVDITSLYEQMEEHALATV